MQIETVQRYLDAWNAHDSAAITATFAEDGTYTDPTAGTLPRAAIAAYADALFAAFPDLRFELHGPAALGDNRVVAPWTMLGTHTGPLLGRPATGGTVAVPGVDIIVVDGPCIQSVTGYFDQKTFFEQLGLQLLLAPQSTERVAYGIAAYVQTGRRTKPGAFSTTWIDVRDAREQAQVVENSHRVVAEVAPKSGLISWLGVIVGNRLFTATAWEDAASAASLLHEPAHRRGMDLFFKEGLGTALHTSVWSVAHQNPIWLRCPRCGAMGQADGAAATCRCGATQPPAPPYW